LLTCVERAETYHHFIHQYTQGPPVYWKRMPNIAVDDLGC
jgi:hypothetical protein